MRNRTARRHFLRSRCRTVRYQCHLGGPPDRSWSALVCDYRVESVEGCIVETQTDFRRYRPEQQFDVVELSDSLKVGHPDGNHERVELAVRIYGIKLDRGEASHWVHALNRKDARILCEQNRASLRCGVRLGFEICCYCWRDFLMMPANGWGPLCAWRIRGAGIRKSTN